MVSLRETPRAVLVTQTPTPAPASAPTSMPTPSNEGELGLCLIIAEILYSSDRGNKEIQFKSVHLATSKQLENLVNGQHSAKTRILKYC